MTIVANNIKLGKAYEVLSDEGRRREYNCMYPAILKARNHAQKPSTGTTNYQKPATSTPKPNAEPQPLSEEAQLAKLQESKRDGAVRWAKKKEDFELSISKLKNKAKKVEREIADLSDPVNELAWAYEGLSMRQQADGSEDNMARREIKRQERKIEIDMKQRRLALLQDRLKMEEKLFQEARGENAAADRALDLKGRKLQEAIAARQSRER
jgi:hypothetical protein